MEFYCLSISHKTTSLDIREKLSCPPSQLGLALEYYKAHSDAFLGSDSEMAIVSTCNRMELYLAFPHDQHPFAHNPEKVRQGLLAFLQQITAYPGTDLAEISIFFSNLDAVKHLFRVAAGLESQVIGEVQIIGQVSEALEAALHAGTARHTLASMFRTALHTAKRAHTETAISKHPASLSSVAVSIAEQILGELNQQPVAVIGAGEMGTLAVQAFHARGAKNLTIVNRTYAHAIPLAQEYGYQALPWESLDEILVKSAVVIAATGAQQPILSAERIKQIMNQRNNSPLLLLDIALPRDIEPATRHVPGVTLVDLDDINQRLHLAFEQRQKEVPLVERIVQEELDDFAHWMNMIPTLGKLHRKAEQIRQQEMKRALKHLPDLEPQVQEQIDRLTRSLVKKILHEPSIRMRNEIKKEELKTYAGFLHFLFGLDEDESPAHESNINSRTYE